MQNKIFHFITCIRKKRHLQSDWLLRTAQTLFFPLALIYQLKWVTFILPAGMENFKIWSIFHFICYKECVSPLQWHIFCPVCSLINSPFWHFCLVQKSFASTMGNMARLVHKEHLTYCSDKAAPYILFLQFHNLPCNTKIPRASCVIFWKFFKPLSCMAKCSRSCICFVKTCKL